MHGIAFATEKTLFDASKDHYTKGNYYNAITETMRYQYLYPQGIHYPESFIIMGKALYKGGDVFNAAMTMDKCSETFSNSPVGEEALYLSGRMRMQSNVMATVRNYNKYIDIYNNSLFTEIIFRDLCFSSIFLYDFEASKRRIEEYKEKYPQGMYLSSLDALLIDMTAEENREMKSMKLAVAGSMLLPGFGYFYTGNYTLGTISFLTNVCLIAIVVDGIIRGNMFQWAFFGMLELSFYQKSLYGAMNSVRSYNSHSDFVNRTRIHFEKDFDLF